MTTEQERREKERMRRIRDAQIAARDPGDSKIPGYNWKQHSQKHASYKEKPLILELFQALPLRFRGAALGFLFGAVIALLLVALVLSPEFELLALVPILICTLVGLVIGKVMQSDPVR